MIDQLGEKLGLEYNDFDIVQMFVEEFAFDAPTQEASRSYYFKHGMGEDEEERRDNAEFYGPIWDRLEEIGVEELQIIVDFVKDQAIKGIDLKQR